MAEMEITPAVADVVIADLPSVTPRKRSKPWSPSEELQLIQEVLSNEHLLFGDWKGPASKSISRKRADTWSEISGKISALSIDCKRDPEEVKKKYFNLKQRAKGKIDSQRRLKNATGGGPALPQLTSAEEALVGCLEGRPGMTGLTCGYDIDEIRKSTETVVTDASTCASEGVPVVGALCSGDGNSTHAEEPQKRKCENDGEKSTKKKRKIYDNQQEETLINTKLDNERLKFEQEKLKLEIEKLKAEISCMKKKEETLTSVKEAADTINLYYQLKSVTN